MALQVYSTLTRKKEPFHKKPGDAVTMYVCGPTVYKPSHIGHMVGPVIFDTVKRYLTYLGYKVTWVVNITDVDDKLIVRAGELKTTVPELATKMTDDYFDCLKKLNVTGIDQFPKATEHIDGMIAMMAKLIEKGCAYPADGDVYFDVSKDQDYGKLCGFDPEQLEGAGREVSGKKKNPGDFALWKGAKPGEPKEVTWESPWGPGRPGWHIECSVMSQKLLGDTLDIHGGGLDLRFPHHENELAQSESASDKTFAKVWMHNGLLKLRTPDGKEDKMSGSLGNVLNVADAFDRGVSGELLRFFLISTHYRSPIDLGTWDPKTEPLPSAIENARKAFDTFIRFTERFQRITGQSFYDSLKVDPRRTLSVDMSGYLSRFGEHMNDDFNTGGAVGVMFELVTTLNRTADLNRLEDSAPKRDDRSLATFGEGAMLLKEMGQILGLFQQKPEAAKLGGDDNLVAGLMSLLIDLRNNLRTTAKGIADKADPTKKALFDQTDLIRKRLAELNVTLEDRPAGTTWRVG
ncbi:cysteine--tRNA ligase [Limnoglobus roseus]|uniref:Cysteine--tRNA ligase n=1 Tax=Limnoglobus roseus TaxID=2598579 RepID=A0A5C1AB81_9BACT|nr:cysteine--tRNA ligase [Limnoglobus roseus]QEL15276.1 cysteine--tRNA ligase [Limnoglobus roseus]